MVVLRQPGQHQLGFSAASLEIDSGRQLDRAGAWLRRRAWRGFYAQQRTAPHLDPDSFVVDDHLIDELSHNLGSFPWPAAEHRCKTGGTAEQSANLVTGHTRTVQPFEQPRRAGQRVHEDADHAIFDLLSGKPPTLRVILSSLRDQRSGDVIAIASAFLDGV